MSAFIVSEKHIKCMVATMYLGPKGNPNNDWRFVGYLPVAMHDNPGQVLIDENLKSIHARYPSSVDNDDEAPGPNNHYWTKPFSYTARACHRLTAVETLKAIACYEYQSCEHDEWEGSAAQRACASFTAALVRALPGYEDAPWEIR